MEVLEKVELKELLTFRNAKCYAVTEHPEVLVIKATSGFIPKTQFQEIFIAVGQEIIKRSVKKLIFDKSSLSVFNQPSMEWYFIVWKERMYHYGLKTHRKILPKDADFRESVEIGRQKIEQAFPDGKYKEMDIKYCESIEEAIAE